VNHNTLKSHLDFYIVTELQRNILAVPIALTGICSHKEGAHSLSPL
jgi:hypothetical protein